MLLIDILNKTVMFKLDCGGWQRPFAFHFINTNNNNNMNKTVIYSLSSYLLCSLTHSLRSFVRSQKTLTNQSFELIYSLPRTHTQAVLKHTNVQDGVRPTLRHVSFRPDKHKEEKEKKENEKEKKENEKEKKEKEGGVVNFFPCNVRGVMHHRCIYSTVWLSSKFMVTASEDTSVHFHQLFQSTNRKHQIIQRRFIKSFDRHFSVVRCLALSSNANVNVNQEKKETNINVNQEKKETNINVNQEKKETIINVNEKERDIDGSVDLVTESDGQSIVLFSGGAREQLFCTKVCIDDGDKLELRGIGFWQREGATHDQRLCSLATFNVFINDGIHIAATGNTEGQVSIFRIKVKQAIECPTTEHLMKMKGEMKGKLKNEMKGKLKGSMKGKLKNVKNKSKTKYQKQKHRQTADDSCLFEGSCNFSSLDRVCCEYNANGKPVLGLATVSWSKLKFKYSDVKVETKYKNDKFGVLFAGSTDGILTVWDVSEPLNQCFNDAVDEH